VNTISRIFSIACLRFCMVIAMEKAIVGGPIGIILRVKRRDPGQD
jgi:hypothetical protein